MTVQEILNFIIDVGRFFGNGVDQSTMLIWLAILDTIFGISYRIKCGVPLLSHNFFSGLIRNFAPTIFPALLTLVLEPTFHRPNDGYLVMSTILFVLVGYFLLQSVVANMILCGFILPPKLKTWLGNWAVHEINSKERK